MLRKDLLLKRICITLGVLLLLAIFFCIWFITLLPKNMNTDELKATQPHDIPYVNNAVRAQRGKILAVVTSTSVMGESGKKTGYELTELARAHYVFKSNGFDVDVASPQGGTPPVVIDGDDMGEFDFAFLNDKLAQQKVENSLELSKVDEADYDAVFFVGGKGAMFDFPQNEAIHSIVSNYYESGKVVGAVCHGPAALVNVKLKNGTDFVANKKVTSFTNDEELFLIPDAKSVFPFLLQTKLEQRGANFNQSPIYLEQVVSDGNLVTGQNPWSVWKLAETMVQQLGYEPLTRKVTAEENTVNVLSIYEEQGYSQAKAKIKSLQSQDENSVDRMLLAMHGLVSVMKFDVGKFFSLAGLLASADND